MKITPEMHDRVHEVLDRLLPGIDDFSWDDEEERDHDLEALAAEVVLAVFRVPTPTSDERDRAFALVEAELREHNLSWIALGSERVTVQGPAVKMYLDEHGPTKVVRLQGEGESLLAAIDALKEDP